jgi:hypothetical protein
MSTTGSHADELTPILRHRRPFHGEHETTTRRDRLAAAAPTASLA